MILFGVSLIIIGLALFRYYYKNSYSDDPKPARTEMQLGAMVLFGLIIIVLSIISWNN